ncbi:MAG: hypothetical protein HZA54_18640 [Planctomycetes bacterium]|nr:hypothetical protein [Planctomycetota bacterium]
MPDTILALLPGLYLILLFVAVLAAIETGRLARARRAGSGSVLVVAILAWAVLVPLAGVLLTHLGRDIALPVLLGLAACGAAFAYGCYLSPQRALRPSRPAAPPPGPAGPPGPRP